VEKKKILPARRVSGAVSVPGDKSISHRLAILAALAEGPSEIAHYCSANDCARTLDCLRRLGVRIEQEKDTVRITGAGLEGLTRSRRKLDAGNSGTTMRMLAGVLAGQKFETTITGDDSLRRRPMRRVIAPLEQMGARIRARNAEFAPLEISGAALSPIEYSMPSPSAQVKSAVLLAGLFAPGSTTVVEPVRTRDHTEIALAEFGADSSRNGKSIRVAGRPRLTGRQISVPGDISSAVFFLAATLVLPGSELLVSGVGLNPTRAAVLDFLAQMGAPMRILNVEMRHGELVGDISIRHAPLEGGKVAGAAVAQMIDELPMLAALGPYTERGIEIRDAAELRVKESDRITALAENLRRMGAQVEEFPDGLRVAGRAAAGAGARLRGAEIDPRGDHRIAMACAIAALGAEGESLLRDADCVAVSFPEFFDTLEAVARS
jgi:3-phosphoshikimate 1-carboxyvinyltransferase